MKTSFPPVILLSGLAFLSLVALPRPGVAVEFHSTIEQARAQKSIENEEPKPLVITFGAAWCPWCRKMDVDTFLDERVKALEEKFHWVKVDVDEQPELAARFRVEGLPQTFVLNKEDRIIAIRPGYIPPEAFVDFLQNAMKNPQPPEDILHDLLVQLAQDESAEQRRETITRLVEHLARPDRDARSVIVAAFVETGPDVWPTLVELMTDERLSVRAAAAGAILQLTRTDLTFDPFASLDQRNTELERWREWLLHRSS